MFKKFTLHKSEKNLLLNIIMAFVIKGLSLLISLFSTPLYIKYFDDNVVLGVWYTILSVLSWITVADLGLGNGLRNKLTQALAAKDEKLAQKYVSSAYVAVSLIILPIAVVGIVLIQFLDLNAVLNISSTVVSNETLKIAVSILFGGVCFNFIVKMISNVIYAMQKSSINNFKALITSILPLIYMLFFKSENIEVNLISLSVVHVLSISLPMIVATIIIFAKPLRFCRPSLKAYDRESARSVMGLGLKFFAAQIFFMLMMSTNEIIINSFFSPEYVVEYNIYYRVFTMVGSLFMLALTPLWSKVTEDLVNKRFLVVKKTNRILYLISALAFLAEFAIIPFLQWFLNIWLQDATIVVDITTALYFALFGGVYIFNIALTTVANGMGDLRTQIVFYGIGSVLKVPAVLLLKLQFEHWNVILLYNSFVLLAFCVFQLFWIEKKIKALIDEENNKITYIGE